MIQILDGRPVAEAISEQVKQSIRNLAAYPSLAVLLCADNSASEIYVRKKREACAKVGINSFLIRPFDGGIENWYRPLHHLLQTIDWLNQDPSIHGILVQLPLPEEIDVHRVFDRIDPLKDVDVFNPINVGLLVQERPRFLPPTPQAIREILTWYGISLSGKKVVIINRSNVVGKPLSAMLIHDQEECANATVCLCHDRTPPEKLAEACHWADIIVVAVGKSGFLSAGMVPDGAVVIDVGVNRDGSGKICGDVDFAAVCNKASAITPVPGGVGPVTVACLLKNTAQAALAICVETGISSRQQNL